MCMDKCMDMCMDVCMDMCEDMRVDTCLASATQSCPGQAPVEPGRKEYRHVDARALGVASATPV